MFVIKISKFLVGLLCFLVTLVIPVVGGQTDASSWAYGKVDQEIAAEQVDEEIVFDAEDQVSLGTTRSWEVASRSGRDTETDSVKGEYLGSFTITAYCDCSECQGRWVGMTASGVVPTAGVTIAVDPSVIPLGSSVYIDGVGWRVAEDVGGAIEGNKIDIFFASHEEAVEWGRQVKQVWLASEAE